MIQKKEETIAMSMSLRKLVVQNSVKLRHDE